MPLTEGDVLDTLSDPVALGIEFYVDKIHIKGEYLTTVRDHIRAGNILVEGGTEDLAHYDQMTDIPSNRRHPTHMVHLAAEGAGAAVSDEELLTQRCQERFAKLRA